MLSEKHMYTGALPVTRAAAQNTERSSLRVWGKLLYEFSRPLANLYARFMFNPDVHWHAPLPTGPKILAANHPSTTDPFLMATLASEHVSILIDERLFKVPMFGKFLHTVEQIPVVHGNGHTAFDEACRRLNAGRTIGIFTEGAVSPIEGGFHAPRTGTARLALSTGAPIIPIGIHLDRERLHLIETQVEDEIAVGTWYLHGPYAITVGEPLQLTGEVEDRPHVRASSERIMQRIITLAQESERRMKNTWGPHPTALIRKPNTL
ncbi:MAG: 1-acyl-sn-glycerol-3-phosphate acyltransferase [Anaerolineae bacterium]|nr:1-acyl-sn-glycerol-3-phosphate acyltransferase [Anaerolineae bacterium]